MPFDVLGVVGSRLLAQRAGIADPAALTRLSLVGGVIGFNPVGIVLGQQLARREAANQAAAAGDATTAGGASGPVQVQVPNVVGQQYDNVAVTLKTLKLTPRRSGVESTTVPRGQVMRIDPAAGTVVSTGATVTVFVSEGILVPDVRGFALKTARSTLNSVGLRIAVDPSGPKEDDAVVTAQVPDPGTPTAADGVVKLTTKPSAGPS